MNDFKNNPRLCNLTKKLKTEYQPESFEQYFSNASQGSYGGEVSVCFKYDELTYKHHWHTHNAFYKVLYDEMRNVIQIYFKETTDSSGWRANFEFARKYFDSFNYGGDDIQLRTASGWGAMYNAIKWTVRNQVKELIESNNVAGVEVIGWSLGSALAQICAQDLFFNYGLKCYIYTFGSVKPWFGYSKKMKAYLSEIYQCCYNFGDINDIVTYMVPFLGYFKLKKCKVAQNKFCLGRLFHPMKYHTEYWKSELYKDWH